MFSTAVQCGGSVRPVIVGSSVCSHKCQCTYNQTRTLKYHLSRSVFCSTSHLEGVHGV